jgi:ABC-type transport system involved in cytochrome bd biosynthesis fused ATPase/permease subunit
MVERTSVLVVVVVVVAAAAGVIVLIATFNVLLSITAISWHLNHDNFQFSFHKLGQNQGQHE